VLLDHEPVAAGLERTLPGPSLRATPEERLKETFVDERRHDFESHLPSGPLGDAWRATWRYLGSNTEDDIGVPFPYLAGHDGFMDLSDAYHSIRGLNALGATQTARGVLEDWLHLGEQYSGLPGSNRYVELGRAGQPRLSTLFLEDVSRNPDPDFLPRAYKVLADDHRYVWSDVYFKHTPNGLNRYSDVDYSHDATMLESGGDKNQLRFHGDAAAYNPSDLNAWMYRTEEDLASMARLMQSRSAASQDESKQWQEKAESWRQAADQRKQTMQKLLWDPKAKLFMDYDVRAGKRSSVPCLASYTVLRCGLLDADADRQQIDDMVAQLDRFRDPANGRLCWTAPDASTEAPQPATPSDLLTLSEGLERYGKDDLAAQIRTEARQAIDAMPITAEAKWLGVRAMLEPYKPAPAAPDPHRADLESLSPEGASRLSRLQGVLALPQSARIEPTQAGRIERRLMELHSSMLKPQVIADVQRRGLFEQVYGLEANGERWSLANRAPQDNVPSFVPTGPEASFGLGNMQVKANLSDATVKLLSPEAALICRDGDQLLVARCGRRLIVGDRAYDLADLPKDTEGHRQLNLPGDILHSFVTAGGNPALERFYADNRDWMKNDQITSPASQVGQLPSRPGWNQLFEFTARGWPQLTIEPALQSQSMQMQFFNPAAVPSIGIFKTQFNWDTMFMFKGMQLQGQGHVAAGMVDNLLGLKKRTGRVPNASSPRYLNKSQAPLVPGMVRMALPLRRQRFGVEATDGWLNAARVLLTKDYQNFWNQPGGRGIREIDGQRVRLSRFGGPNSKFAMDESGYDTTSRFKGRALDIVPADLNAFLWKYAKDMQAMLGELRASGESKGDAARVQRCDRLIAWWQREADRRKADLIKYCWDEEDGMFRDRIFQGPEQGLIKDQKALAPTVAPLWVGMLDASNPTEKRMIERSLEHLVDFEKPYGLAATAEDYGHPEMQWNSPSGWAVLLMMAVEAASRCGRYDLAAKFTGQWLDVIDKVFQEHGQVWERYNMVTGGHPPVQAGRYEETQGEGPGFGWTNSSVAWALVEVIGGGRIDRWPGHDALHVTPVIPPQLQGQDVRVHFAEPGGQGSWDLQHRWDGTSYQGVVSGDFSNLHDCDITTPPLPPGRAPRVEGAKPTSIETIETHDGKVQYRIRFERLDGNRRLAVHV
jgi:alpha,alpha-trehalase